MKTTFELIDECLKVNNGHFKDARITVSRETIAQLMEDYHKQFPQMKQGESFKCPECGKEIQYGFSEETLQQIRESRLFKNRPDPTDVNPYDSKALKRTRKRI